MLLQSTNVNVKVDGVKGDLKDLTAKVEQNTKDINVAGTIAIENRKFIGDNKAAIANNKAAIANNTTNINVNAKAIDELKGHIWYSNHKYRKHNY